MSIIAMFYTAACLIFDYHILNNFIDEKHRYVYLLFQMPVVFITHPLKIILYLASKFNIPLSLWIIMALNICDTWFVFSMSFTFESQDLNHLTIIKTLLLGGNFLLASYIILSKKKRVVSQK
ncbi:hypothetical protein APED_18365 [Acanthopleuribacter pedis]